MTSSRSGSDKPLPKRLQPVLRVLEKDLLERAKLPGVEAGLRAAWEAEKKAGETGQGFDPWRRARVTQIAVAWVLSVVFVRTLEDRGFIDPRIAGPDDQRLASARDRESTFLQVTPFLGPREYLLAVFRELAHLPGAREVFDARHNPIWVLAPSSEGARALLDFFQQVDAATGAPNFTFPGNETRFLGDLYQNLSEAVRKRYALLQTPDFVEKFILEQTLHPAIEEFGLAEVKLIDPTCGSGHFLLGAFRDLLSAWQKHEPGTPIEELARRALGQIFGVDINPYAVAIARFRLVLAVLDAVGIKRLDKAPALRPKVVVADSLLHRLEVQQRLSQQLSMDEWADWGDGLFRLAVPGAVAEILSQRYHAVVGNPPYITEKDASKRKKYREMYESAAGKYTLAAPFTERFFELAVQGGFVGLINASAFTKRQFGKALLKKVLPRLDLTKIVDTAGVYIPGPGIPTIMLFGRRRPPTNTQIVAVLGKRGEQRAPEDPAGAPVWSEIRKHHEEVRFDGCFISVESISRGAVSEHPWVLAGGGARTLLATIQRGAGKTLSQRGGSVGVLAVSGEDSAFVLPNAVLDRHSVSRRVRYAAGDDVRDWCVATPNSIVWNYDRQYEPIRLDDSDPTLRFLWFARTLLSQRKRFSVPMVDRGMKWHELQELYASKLSTPHLVTFGEIATHNHFVYCDGRNIVCGRPAPVVKLADDAERTDYQAIVGFLNSSAVAFWCRLVMFAYSGDQTGEGRVSAKQWDRHLQYAGNLLQQLPVPSLDQLRETLLDLVMAVDDVVARVDEIGPAATVAEVLATTPTLGALREARSRTIAERARLRRKLVSLQEEMDWRVYGLFGLPTVTASTVEESTVAVEPNHRPFEVRLARETNTDISASEWFRVHKREAPEDVAGPLTDLYRQRLRLLDDPERGRELRLLETPETKRRWSPPDDTKVFNNAVRAWLLERIETTFQKQVTPELRTARQLALDLGRDPAVQAVQELLTEESGVDLVRLTSDLVDAEGVPFLAGYRYAETGMEKRASWEETWRLQRLEDAGTLDPELKRLGLKAIPLPDKYATKDFLRHYWGRRGKLDVPKERFVTFPGGNTEDDPTPLVGWAGWDHLQTSQALAALYQRRKTEDGWTGERLVPLLAGLAERVPWLLQWHNDFNDTYGMKVGEFFRDFVAGEAHALGVAVDFTKATDDLRTWTPPAAPKRKSLEPDEAYAALLQWTPAPSDDESDEDSGDDEESEPHSADEQRGPTADELASEVGASKPLVNKALKKLLADGRIEKLEGRTGRKKTVRYVATGDDA